MRLINYNRNFTVVKAVVTMITVATITMLTLYTINELLRTIHGN